MTNKGEVIVNKINLKECKYFKGVGCICDSFRFWGCTKLGGMCSEHPDCYFKQLKRKEQALDEIEKLIPKFDTSDGCSYGDYDCENCSDLDEDIVCTYKLKKIIKGIINKTKESK